MKALVGAFNQEKALVGAFSVIVQPVVEPMDHYTALIERLIDYQFSASLFSENYFTIKLFNHLSRVPGYKSCSCSLLI